MQQCGRCNGRGQVFGSQSGPDQTARRGFIQCPVCRGEGFVDKPPEEDTIADSAPRSTRPTHEESAQIRAQLPRSDPRQRPILSPSEAYLLNTKSKSKATTKNAKRRRTRRFPLRRLLLALIAIAVVFTWWPVDSYGEGPVWSLKHSADLLASSAWSPIQEYTAEQREGYRASQEERKVEAEQSRQKFIAEIESEIVAITNQERRSVGRRSLKRDKAIDVIARRHSDNMLAQGQLEHELDGRDSNDRARAAGYNCRRDLGGGRYTFGLAENISYRSPYGTAPSRVAAEIVAGWMSSPGHRENILDRESARIGVGVAVNGREIYATQNFSPCL